MKLLLDTAAVIWIATDESKVSAAARNAYLDRANTTCISVISIWELLVKNRLGKLPLPSSIPDLIRPMRTHGVSVISLTESAVLRLQGLPDLHRDPFDRMLICQAIDEDLTIVTPDQLIRTYPVKSLW
jgi:PIN domain nuclease of toxin-antitoxin system